MRCEAIIRGKRVLGLRHVRRARIATCAALIGLFVQSAHAAEYVCQRETPKRDGLGDLLVISGNDALIPSSSFRISKVRVLHATPKRRIGTITHNMTCGRIQRLLETYPWPLGRENAYHRMYPCLSVDRAVFQSCQSVHLAYKSLFQSTKLFTCFRDGETTELGAEGVSRPLTMLNMLHTSTESQSPEFRWRVERVDTQTQIRPFAPSEQFETERQEGVFVCVKHTD